ncbi:DinB family protein [Cohnella zeiphila]|uniref:DinB family protein n=1 Tax=Cohnella zeiphila TaxID=2761120 RepID=A0A7X0VWX2_9BACL|nr:DinB family protein [Cohnella zeiphila]MBB6731348.1 DinB family protein [Cohnella zeiphila]
MSQIIVHSAQTVRQLVLQHAQAIPEELYDTQPAAFNNTIRWNIGHIVFWMDSYRSLCFSEKSALPPSYAAFFNSGTKPSDWIDAPPSKEELIGQLSRQLDDMADLPLDVMNEPFPSPLQMGPLTFSLAGELFNFSLLHEAIHLSVIASLLKVIQANSALAANR